MPPFLLPEAIEALEAAGWPSVAEDLRDGVSTQVVLRRLRNINEEDSEAYAIVSLVTTEGA